MSVLVCFVPLVISQCADFVVCHPLCLATTSTHSPTQMAATLEEIRVKNRQLAESNLNKQSNINEVRCVWAALCVCGIGHTVHSGATLVACLRHSRVRRPHVGCL